MTGFADDAALVVAGIDPGILVQRAQEVVNLAVDWGKSVGLKFNAKKTAVILFHNKNKVSTSNMAKLHVDGDHVEFVDETKYLGVVLD